MSALLLGVCLAVAGALLYVIVSCHAVRPKKPFRTDRCQTLALTGGSSDGAARTLGYALHGTPLAQAKRVVLYFHGLCGSRLEAVTINDYEDLKTRGIAWIGVDRPGVGLSSYVAQRTLLDWARDIEQLLAHLQVDRFALVGFSSGCPYVNACVAHFGPKRVLSATLVGGQGPFSAYQPPAPGDTLAGFQKGYKPLLFFNRVMATPHLRWLAKLYYANITWSFWRSPKQQTKAFWGGKLVHSHADTLAMLTANSRACFSASAAPWSGVAEALVQDLSLPNTPWPFALSDCKTRYFVHHGKADKMRPVHESLYVAAHLTNASAVDTTYHPNTGHTLHLFQDNWRKILDEILSVPAP